MSMKCHNHRLQPTRTCKRCMPYNLRNLIQTNDCMHTPKVFARHLAHWIGARNTHYSKIHPVKCIQTKEHLACLIPKDIVNNFFGQTQPPSIGLMDLLLSMIKSPRHNLQNIVTNQDKNHSITVELKNYSRTCLKRPPCILQYF